MEGRDRKNPIPGRKERMSRRWVKFQELTGKCYMAMAGLEKSRSYGFVDYGGLEYR